MAMNNLNCGMRACVGALLLCLAAPFAFAGPEQDTELAEKEFARGDLKKSLSLWRNAAKQGYAPAQVWLGDILDKGEEDEEAVAWYRKAAAQGSAAGEFGLGQMYAKGEGVKKDFAQARSYISRAAEKDYLQAVIAMMEMHKKGDLGATRDPVLAAQWEAKVKQLSQKETTPVQKQTAQATAQAKDK
ncbi:MAG TPA: hypothetical protein DHV59_08830 [Oxalobacteraceae bacterium]|nr:hypothetical protein [Oxalobacteraceae bacterium]